MFWSLLDWLSHPTFNIWAGDCEHRQDQWFTKVYDETPCKSTPCDASLQDLVCRGGRSRVQHSGFYVLWFPISGTVSTVNLLILNGVGLSRAWWNADALEVFGVLMCGHNAELWILSVRVARVVTLNTFQKCGLSGILFASTYVLIVWDHVSGIGSSAGHNSFSSCFENLPFSLFIRFILVDLLILIRSCHLYHGCHRLQVRLASHQELLLMWVCLFCFVGFVEMICAWLKSTLPGIAIVLGCPHLPGAKIGHVWQSESQILSTFGSERKFHMHRIALFSLWPSSWVVSTFQPRSVMFDYRGTFGGEIKFHL